MPDIRLDLDVVDTLAETPTGEPFSSPDSLLTYYTDDQQTVAYVPDCGHLRFDLTHGTTEGQIVPTVLNTYGVFEDIIAAGLSPHLRRHGFFVLDAFAAVRDDYAVLLLGIDSAAKAKIGVTLVDAGWQLLSLASPLLNEDDELLSFPSLLAAPPDTYPNLRARSDRADYIAPGEMSQRVVISPDAIWSNPWAERASIRSLFFLRFEERNRPAVETMRSSEALRRLVPHAIEQWDRAMVPKHLRLLRRVVDRAPSYMLRLGSDVSSLPALLASSL